MASKETLAGKLAKAKMVMEKANQLSPRTEQNNIPGIDSALASAGVGGGYGNYNDNYTINENNSAKLPSGIAESFKNNPIDSAMSVLDSLNFDMGGMNNTSKQQNNNQFLDGLDEEPYPTYQQTRQQIRETKQQSLPTSNSQIDYSLIKMIVESAVKEAMTKNNLTDGKLSIVQMSSGNTIRFVTTKGDIFEGKLIKKTNINNI